MKLMASCFGYYAHLLSHILSVTLERYDVTVFIICPYQVIIYIRSNLLFEYLLRNFFYATVHVESVKIDHL